MKNLIRAAALSLLATGTFATAHINPASPALTGKTSAMPVPSCPYNDPNGCMSTQKGS